MNKITHEIAEKSETIEDLLKNSLMACLEEANRIGEVDTTIVCGNGEFKIKIIKQPN